VGDRVEVLTGRDRGRTGVLKAFVGEDRGVIDGLSQSRKAVKPNPQKDIKGGIVLVDRPIHVSNVAFYDETVGQATRIRFKVLEDGKKVRVSVRSGEVV